MSNSLLVCLLPARNAAADLPGFLAAADRVCDAVVALDDGSIDGTADLLAASPLVKTLLSNPPRPAYGGWSEAADRNRLLTAAADLDPAWILSLDADERIDVADAVALRAFLRLHADPARYYAFRCIPMRGEGEPDRFLPRFRWINRLFAFAPGQCFPNGHFHFGLIPVGFGRDARCRTTLRVRHLGSATEARRRARYDKYRQADPARFAAGGYEHVLFEPADPLVRWRSRPSDLAVPLDDALVPAEVGGGLIPRLLRPGTTRRAAFLREQIIGRQGRPPGLPPGTDWWP